MRHNTSQPRPVRLVATEIVELSEHGRIACKSDVSRVVIARGDKIEAIRGPVLGLLTRMFHPALETRDYGNVVVDRDRPSPMAVDLKRGRLSALTRHCTGTIVPFGMAVR